MIQTEFEFVLPKGYVDGEGNLHRNGVMRLSTARDEILPLQDFRVKQNRAYLIVILLSRVITRLGTLRGEEIHPQVMESLYSADLTYLQDFYRKINDEEESMIAATCPSCGTEFDTEGPSGGES